MNIKDMDKLNIGDVVQEGDYYHSEITGDTQPTSCAGTTVSQNQKDNYYRPRKAKESTGMSNQDKIAVIEAYERGEEIESRSKDGDRWNGRNFKPDWSVNPHPVFDFYGFEYRIKPKVTSGQRIREVISEFSIHSVDACALAWQAMNQKRIHINSPKRIWTADDNSGRYDLTFYHNGDIELGCKFFKWEETDAYAKEEGWWK
jgi:hypothetical protein